MSKTCVTIHNFTQTVAWISIFTVLAIKMVKNPYGTFYNPRVNCAGLISFYMIVQNLQILDAIFALLGWTRTNVAAVVP